MALFNSNRGNAPALKRTGRIPTKQSINFALVGMKRTNWKLMGPILLVVALLAVAFVKFMVYDRLAAVARAEAEANMAERELAECNERIAQYGELNQIYAHYTYSGMTEEELALVDRIEAMDLLADVVLPRTRVNEWSLNGNRLTLNVEGNTLQSINDTAQALLSHKLVDYCEVNTATTDPRTSYGVNSSRNSTGVTASIVIHLVKQEEAKS